MQRWILTPDGRDRVKKLINDNKDSVCRCFPGAVFETAVTDILFRLECAANEVGFTLNNTVHFTRDIYATTDDFVLKRF